MIPAVVPIKLTRGDLHRMGLRIRTKVWDPDANDGAGGYVPGPYRDLTGCSVLAQVRKTTEDTTVLGAWTATILDQNDAATKGKVRLEMPHAVSKLLPLTNDKTKEIWVYDVQIEDPSGEPETYIGGPLRVIGDTSRDD